MKNFKLKPRILEFTSVEFLTSSEKEKIYKDFVKFLNNHFKKSCFSKRLYNHFHLHCGFIAHYNINGFYGEYFSIAAKFHKLYSGYSNLSEYEKCITLKPNDTASECFVDIFKSLINKNEPLGFFFQMIMQKDSFYGDNNYKDINDAIKSAFLEYIETFNEYINKSLDKYENDNKKEKFKKKKEKIIEKTLIVEEVEENNVVPVIYTSSKQLTLFEF
ncbi:hypothetical protein CP985_10955 [Malaciobacter mytili LMG 24559]|uniref:Uncharacterized protein n=1 Tax=Malaciobacter mytili LMG 24559 TaxID=1032238 RepID=A0AAX2AF08_9BACT|nr:hypothetical protein [Malaciobacter mytili]AXH16316.1 hypothetical protein AMYT_a0016 [Malaciobacter mytili LMG 24559]RXK14982.1 hypothetical protein CP985_10955 [Malaciobacter mytili LMG 24559]